MKILLITAITALSLLLTSCSATGTAENISPRSSSALMEDDPEDLANKKVVVTAPPLPTATEITAAHAEPLQTSHITQADVETEDTTAASAAVTAPAKETTGTAETKASEAAPSPETAPPAETVYISEENTLAIAPVTRKPETEATAPEASAPAAETKAPVTTAAATEGATAPTEEQTTERSAETETDPEEITYITSGGTYTLSGIKKDVTVTVDAGDEDVTLVLNGVIINNSNGPAIYVKSAKNVELVLAEGTENTVADGQSYSLTDGTSAVDGAIFSRADLKISGSGKLSVYGCCKHGIVSKDELEIKGGDIYVLCCNVGLNGKDCVEISAGVVSIDSGTDGIRSKNLEDAERGYVKVSGGTVTIVSGNDGIQASAALTVSGGAVRINAGKDIAADGSYKGLKCNGEMILCGGECTVFAKDDALHSDTKITVSGGTYFCAGLSGAKQGIIGNGQGVLLFKTDDRSAGVPLSVKDADGNTVCSAAPEFDYAVVMVSNDMIESGKDYTVSVEDSEGTFTAK